MKWSILEGDALERLRDLPDGSVHTCVTSPPYFNLRDYGGRPEQIGLEETPEEYVAHLVAVFAEVWRVLRDDGTLWLNLGDSYNAYNGNRGSSTSISRRQEKALPKYESGQGLTVKTLKPKDLVGIPWRVAFALQQAGWYLRSDIIWAKPNPMPESVLDRPTRAHEYVFLLTKSTRYFYDAEAIKEEDQGRNSGNVDRKLADGTDSRLNTHLGRSVPWEAGSGRNRRSVWTVPTKAYPGAHFATFPPKLIEPCILAGAGHDVCGICGAPWERIVEREIDESKPRARQNIIPPEVTKNGDGSNAVGSSTWGHYLTSRTVGWEATCDHDDRSGRGVVLDPFAGACTTGIVSLTHGREFIGIELNPEYVTLGRNRIIDHHGLVAAAGEAA